MLDINGIECLVMVQMKGSNTHHGYDLERYVSNVLTIQCSSVRAYIVNKGKNINWIAVSGIL